MSDPIINDKINEEKKNPEIGSSGIFGGGEDVFENEELFRPVDGDGNPKLKAEKKEEDLNLNIEDNTEINNQGEVREKIFDPIFTDEDKNEIINIDNNNKVIEDIPVIDFHKEEIEKKTLEIQEEKPISKDDFLVEINDTENENEEINKDIEEETQATISNDEIIVEKEPEEEKSDLMKKYGELVNKTKELYVITQMEDGEYVELIGGDTGKSHVIYNLWLIKEDEEKNSILISKVETDAETKDQQQNNLQFKDNDGALEILLDEQVLYDEIQDLKDDQNKKMQVIDKLNKFIFLVSEELKVYERDRKEKERMEQERRKLRDIFRNF